MFGCIPIYVARVALAYIDWRRQMMRSLLGGRGGAQLVTEELSLSRRSPALQSKMRINRVAEQAKRRLVTTSEPVEDCYDILLSPHRTSHTPGSIHNMGIIFRLPRFELGSWRLKSPNLANRVPLS
ncbi:hypothetical protein Syun_000062 [Stephania yunnanensis]|uniref:Uncharacterized protein n=1 Tax=Stephania yunnanensis TaxID=152371 RepID=A0AAP0LB70_9MAGN